MKKKKIIIIGLVLLVNLCLFGEWNEFQKILSSDGEDSDNFGTSISISGEYAAIGANDSGSYNTGDNGAVYIFKKIEHNWIEQTKITASDGAIGDIFGTSVSLENDYLVVGAHGDDDNGNHSGSTYVFKRESNVWVEQTKLVPTDGNTEDYFGGEVFIENNFIFVGALGDDDQGSKSGSVYIFEKDGENGVQHQKINCGHYAYNANFGASISVSGEYAIIGAYQEYVNGVSYAGKVYIFTKIDNIWTLQSTLSNNFPEQSDLFGASVSIDDDYAIVGIWKDNDNGSNSGAACIYHRIGNTWTEQIKITASDGSSNDYFGRSVSISGDLALVGAYGDDYNGSYSGSAYIFQRDGTNWLEQAKLTASDGSSDDGFSQSVSISGDLALIGANGNDDNGSNSGSVYNFQYSSFQADFTSPETAYIGEQIQFTDISSGNPIFWEWDFENDGTIDSYEQNPSWIYNNSGTYTVSLIASDANYSSIMLKQDYIVIYSTEADFSADSNNGHTPLVVNFSDLSSGNPISWEWDFENDGTIDSYEQNPTYSYTDAGVYSVSLTVNDLSTTSSITMNDLIIVKDIVADFEANPIEGYQPLDVDFTDLSTSTNTTITVWSWDFENDGIIDSNEQNPSFVDTLIIQDYINVIPPPVIEVNPPQITESYYNNEINTVDLSINNSGDSDLEYTIEKSSSVLDLNGIDGYMTCGTDQSLNLSDTFTIETWIYPTGWGEQGTSGYGRIIDKNKFLIFLHNYANSYYNDHSLLINMTIAGTGFNANTPVNSITLNEWQHIAISYDGNTLQIYINGILQTLAYPSGNGAPQGSIDDNSNDILHIGESANMNRAFSGMMDEIRIWNSCKDSTSINETMNSTINPDETDLVGYWAFDDQTGDDVSQNNNHGILSANASISNSSVPILNWLTFDPDSGSLLPSLDEIIQISIDSNELPINTYFFSNLLINSNDPVNPVIVVPIEIFIADPLIADFDANQYQGSVPLTVNFTDLSSGIPTSWSWDFENDGIVDSNVQNPTWIYTSTGNYTVKLTVNDGTNEDAETKINYIVVNASPPSIPQNVNVEVLNLDAIITWDEVTTNQNGDPLQYAKN